MLDVHMAAAMLRTWKGLPPEDVARGFAAVLRSCLRLAVVVKEEKKTNGKKLPPAAPVAALAEASRELEASLLFRLQDNGRDPLCLAVYQHLPGGHEPVLVVATNAAFDRCLGAALPAQTDKAMVLHLLPR